MHCCCQFCAVCVCLFLCWCVEKCLIVHSFPLLLFCCFSLLFSQARDVCDTTTQQHEEGNQIQKILQFRFWKEMSEMKGKRRVKVMWWYKKWYKDGKSSVELVLLISPQKETKKKWSCRRSRGGVSTRTARNESVQRVKGRCVVNMVECAKMGMWPTESALREDIMSWRPSPTWFPKLWKISPPSPRRSITLYVQTKMDAAMLGGAPFLLGWRREIIRKHLTYTYTSAHQNCSSRSGKISLAVGRRG